MSQISFDQISSNNSNSGVRVGFFGLSNDGDEAVVRIMHDSVNTFDIVTTHQIKLQNGQYRRVNCIRDPHESLDKCPFCASGDKVQQRIYIHLIQYVKDETGQIVAIPKVWERSASYATTIKNLMDEYGPLSDSIFKIRRNGAKGSMDTTYAIMYGNPAVYRAEMYPKNEGVFADYHAVGNVVFDKSFEELAAFKATGMFPTPQQNVIPQNDNSDVPFVMGNEPISTPQVTTIPQAQFGGLTPTTSTSAPTNWQSAPSVNKPVRYY